MQLYANEELKYQCEEMVLSLYGYCSVTPVACASFVHVERRICFSADIVYREIVCEGF
jgi:hypothetical protein